MYGLGRYFLCRHCHNFAYASQNEDKVDQLNCKMRKLRSKVGGSSDDLIPPFPRNPRDALGDLPSPRAEGLRPDREKMRIFSQQISCLEAEENLLRRIGEDEGD